MRDGLIVLAAILIAVWAIIPPAEKLRRGKDLAGGVTLVYTVEVEPGADAKSEINNTIEVLKRRVNPTGALDISMVAQGENRIEVAMPLPSDRVRALKGDYDAALSALEGSAVDSSTLERVLRLEGDARERGILDLAGGDDVRLARIRESARAYDAAQVARLEFERASSGGDPQDRLDTLAAAAADAEIAYDAARKNVLALAVRPEDVRRAIELPDEERSLLDRASGELVTLPSPRDLALQRLREQHHDAAPKIDAALRAYEVYSLERTGLDDPADLKRMLRGSGVLSYRIAIAPGELPDEPTLRRQLAERGARNAGSGEARWHQVENIETWYDSVQDLRALQEDPAGYFAVRGLIGAERDGLYYVLLWDKPGLRLTPAEGAWRVKRAFPTPDQRGFPAIGFEMDPLGASLLGDLTGANVGKQMAVLLDEKVYTAPMLKGKISGNGIIEGGRSGFDQAEIDYIVNTLRAGSLAARLSEDPIYQDTTGPALGADNLKKGLVAGVYSFILVSAFMIVWYFGPGVIAVISLAVAGLTLLGLMALGRASFTMPGIAGIVLTFGMAVDANVLIYERIREELQAGHNVKAAVRIGFQKALSAIVDGNLTTLIVAFVLYRFGTTEIRGFAVTLGVGIVTTLFASLVVARFLFAIGVELLHWRSIPMLPSAIPALGRLIEPKIDWVGKRWFFYGLSAVLLTMGVATMVHQGPKMFDNEFRGGTSATFNLKMIDPDGDGPAPAAPKVMTRAEVEQRLRAKASSYPTGSAEATLLTATVVALNPEADKVSSSQFAIKTVVSDPEIVSKVVIDAFADVLDAQPPLELGSADPREIVKPALGDNIDQPAVRDDVSSYLGGVAVVVRGIDPPSSLDDLRTRLDKLRAQPDNADTLLWETDVVVLEGTRDNVTSAAFLANDRTLSVFADAARWRIEVAQRHERLVRDALEQGATLAGVQSFSPAIAADFAAKAAVAIVLSLIGITIYVWVRFGSIRYSLGAVLADLHDAIVAVGLIAIVEVIYEKFPGVAAVLLLEPFKIDLAMVAAVLTVLGYSLNDSIVVLDRIRENRGKLHYATRDVVNLSLNQTLSRTIITAGTTLISCAVLYVVAGQSIRGFAFAIFVGVVAGTYSSIGIAAPMVWSRKIPVAGKAATRAADAGSPATT